MRDFEQDPYSVDEKRVAEYLREATTVTVAFAVTKSAGDDPIGFLIAAHVAAVHSCQGALQALAPFRNI